MLRLGKTLLLSSRYPKTITPTTTTFLSSTPNTTRRIMTVASNQYLADTNAPICRLEVSKHFDTLTDTQKLYAHYIARASWEGARVLSRSQSEYAPGLYQLFEEIFTDPAARESQPRVRDIEALKAKAGLSEDSWKYFLEYAAQVFYNLGNFKSFGDTKFLPRLPVDELEKVVKSADSPKATELFGQLREFIYQVEPTEGLLIGFPAEGHISGYYSSNVSKADVQTVQALLEKSDISALNTRLLKTSDNKFELHVACADAYKPTKTLKGDDGLEVKVIYGEFAPHFAKIEENIRKAIPYAANKHQKKMLECYAESFHTGSIEAHRESQRHWIKDVGPTVETNIGFIETYRDPAGVRAEWEGFVAVVNKEMTQKFEVLVNKAEKFVGRLPWPKEFEVDKFIKPDFTSLEVMSFATSGSPPAGINIPNYNDIRMAEGFKNVSLGNVLSAKAPNEKITFVKEEDLALFKKYMGPAFEVQVGLHELLGHGSGKLLQEEPAGKYNFDHDNLPISPITGKKITTWYKPGETWGSVFKSAASSYEECRAEAVAMYLCVDREILSIFGHNDQEALDIFFCCYLQMARAGLVALEFYDPKSKKWGQAHMQARFAILQVFLEAGLVKIETNTSGDNLAIHLDRTKIETDGVQAVGTFLQKLNVYKATADAAEGLKFYTAQTTVPDSWAKYRDIVLAQKQPRKIFLQCNTFVEESSTEKVVFKEYPVTLEGYIESCIERNV